MTAMSVDSDHPGWCPHLGCIQGEVDVHHFEGATVPFVPRFDPQSWVTLERHRGDEVHDGHQVRFLAGGVLTIRNGTAELTARELVALGEFLVERGTGLLAEPHDVERVQ